MTTALEGGEGSASRPGRSYTPGKDLVPIVQEGGWAPGPVWTGAVNLAPPGEERISRSNLICICSSQRRDSPVEETDAASVAYRLHVTSLTELAACVT